MKLTEGLISYIAAGIHNIDECYSYCPDDEGYLYNKKYHEEFLSVRKIQMFMAAKILDIHADLIRISKEKDRVFDACFEDLDDLCAITVDFACTAFRKCGWSFSSHVLLDSFDLQSLYGCDEEEVESSLRSMLSDSYDGEESFSDEIVACCKEILEWDPEEVSIFVMGNSRIDAIFEKAKKDVKIATNTYYRKLMMCIGQFEDEGAWIPNGNSYKCVNGSFIMYQIYFYAPGGNHREYQFDIAKTVCLLYINECLEHLERL